MNQPVAKKNPDYSKSAKDLHNLPVTIAAYNAWTKKTAELSLKQAEIEAAVPAGLIAARNTLQEEVNLAWMNLKETVNKYGGYQDTIAGQYALIIEAKNPQYDTNAFMFNYPNFIPEVIEQTVDEKALNQLIKEKKLDEAELIQRGVITFKIVERTIIK